MQHCQTPEHPHSHFLQLPASFPSHIVLMKQLFPLISMPAQRGAGDVLICSPRFCLCLSVSTFAFGDPDQIMERERHSCHCGSLPCIGPDCCSTYLESGWEANVSLQRISPFFLHRSSWLLLAPLLSPPVPVITAPPCSLCPEGAHRFQWIRNLVPEFGISSSHVKVLSSPAEFYELLKVRCGLQLVGMV